MPQTEGNELPWRIDNDGVTISVRLTPKGGRDAIDGIGELSDGRSVLLARVRSVPEDGAANQALLKLLAKATGVPASAADLVSGHTSRLKTVRLAGEGSGIAEALTALLAAGSRGPNKRGKKA
ncbi:DUF167 family protein [Pseudochelatococcus contaminans]|uniref:UPF0235 protein FHS81_001634 n=1 Tax=Pseudochelatococcus contaminans TaxID=1538103 RepID=A0A7W5Z4G4_9HYPH|nr:DUF167 family protein [Pseudochelatococcus contaminans]MBB3809552.1 hypothetical protein [Pseudochelatococcus contaminans]